MKEIGDFILVEKTCPFCGSKNALPVKKTGYRAWMNGAYVQNAFPELNANEREFLINGMCEDCEKIFANMEE